MHGLQIRCVIVVGYQNYGIDNGVSKLSAPTFLKIGGARTLGDLKFTSKDGTSFLPSACYINLYDTIGNQLKVIDNTWITEKYPATKTDRYTKTAVVTFGYSTTKGHWYLIKDQNYSYIMDDYPIADGDGYMMRVSSSHAAGVSLNYNGQVDDADLPIILPLGVSKLSGNVAPKNITLKDIVFKSNNETEFFPADCYINFYDTIGNQLKVIDDEWITTKYPATTTDRYTKTAAVSFGYSTANGHWYLTKDQKYSYIMDDYPISAGAGFMARLSGTHAEGVTVILPPALEKVAK